MSAAQKCPESTRHAEHGRTRPQRTSQTARNGPHQILASRMVVGPRSRVADAVQDCSKRLHAEATGVRTPTAESESDASSSRRYQQYSATDKAAMQSSQTTRKICILWSPNDLGEEQATGKASSEGVTAVLASCADRPL